MDIRATFTEIFSNRKKVRKIIYYTAATILSLSLLSFAVRNVVFSYYVKKKVEHFNQTNHAQLVIREASIRGISSLQISGISLKALNSDTLIKIDSAYATFNILKILTGRLALQNFELRNFYLTLTRRDSTSNYSFLFEKKTNKENLDTNETTVNYANRAKKLLIGVFDKIPSSLLITNFNVSSKTNGHLVSLHVDRFEVDNNNFKSSILVTEESIEKRWIAEGKLDNHNRVASFKLYSGDRQKVDLPFINYKWKAEACFDTLSISLAEQEGTRSITSIQGSLAIRGLVVKHDKIAADKIQFNDASISYMLNIGNDYLEIDSTSLITFNKLNFHPYIKYRPKPSGVITLKVNTQKFPAQDLFSSIPEGLFTTLNGIKVRGELSYFLNFNVDLAIPDSLTFITDLKRFNFGIQSYGNTDLSKMNGEFAYTAYEKGEPIRTFLVGPGNPNFRTIDQISPFLKVSVLNSEDAAFYFHRGFIPESFRESIITNIKENRFARGGSTISMQLVKNVFLSRNKTIARKLEEVLIVWLIENQAISTKDRMYETYLNIIEWGPMVYGANEAAHFYFNKDASKLTLAESIFLASVIPHPKWFKYSFDENKHLKEFLKNFYERMSEKMLKKEQITQQDFDNLVPDVDLKGPAKLLLMKKDTAAIDSSAFILPIPNL